MTLNIALRLTCAVLVMLLLARGAMAQIPGVPAKPEAAASSPAEPTTIPMAELPFRADEDEAFVNEVIKRSASVARLSALQAELALIKRNVDALGSDTQGDQLNAMPLANLETLDRYLGYLDRELRDWQSSQQAAARPVSTDAAAIVQKRRLWQETQRAIGADMVPALAQRVEALQKAFFQAEQAVSQPLGKLLAMGREANALQARVSKTTQATRERIAVVDRRLWQRDTDNLYVALQDADLRQRLDLGAVRDQLRTESSFADEFDRSSRSLDNGLLTIVVLILPVLIVLSSRAKKAFADDPGLEGHRMALTRPWSAWLLLALTLLIALHFFGPATRIKVLLALAWLPIMRLQPQRIRILFGRGIYFTAVFIVLNLAAYAISSLALPYRLLILANSLSLAAVLGWFLWRVVRALRQHSTRFQRMLRALLGGGVLAMVVAVLANLVGNVTLAAMLTEATLQSAYIGLYLLAAGNVVRGWLRYVFRPTAQRLKADHRHAGSLLQVLAQLFEIALLLAWLQGTLEAFRVRRPLQDWLTATFAFEIGIGDLSVSVGGVALFMLSVFLSFWVARTVRYVLADDVLPRLTLPRGVANSVSTMTYYALLMLGLMVALGAAGFKVSQLAFVLGALSLGIGFGLQNVVNNFVSGLILMFERPVQPGDTVELSGTIGTIREIGMRATTFTTFEGADVVVPNGMLLSEKLVNWTLSTTTRRIELPVGVAYGSDPEQVRALLVQVVEGTEGVAVQPPPTVLFTGFGASSLDFSVRAWTSFDDHVFVRSRLALAVHAALKHAGIEIPFPQQDLHLRSIDPELLDRVRREAS